jgi:uncharacterized protein YggE
MTEPIAPARIVVPGHGAVRVEPEVADIRLGGLIVRGSASEARAAAATVMSAVVAALRERGVAPRDLRTSLLGLDAVRDYSGPTPRVTGYQLTNAVEATIRSVGTVGEVVDAALAAGGTSLDGLAFRLDDPTDAYAEARRRAVADARRRAETLAAEAGVTLGGVRSIVEGVGFAAPPVAAPAAMFRMKAEADASTPVESGTSELAIDVTVEFGLD